MLGKSWKLVHWNEMDKLTMVYTCMTYQERFYAKIKMQRKCLCGNNAFQFKFTHSVQLVTQHNWYCIHFEHSTIWDSCYVCGLERRTRKRDVWTVDSCVWRMEILGTERPLCRTFFDTMSWLEMVCCDCSSILGAKCDAHAFRIHSI